MDGRIKRFILAGIIFCAAVLACGFPLGGKTPNVQRTLLAATVFIMQTEVSTLQTPEPSDTATFTPFITDTITLTPLPTAQNPLVIRKTLCWLGPGSAYEVASSLHAGTRVILLAEGSIPGWWIVEGPVYHDPCWVSQEDLQFDINYNFSELQIVDPPSTPKPSKKP
jgi:hypothetical protein